MGRRGGLVVAVLLGLALGLWLLRGEGDREDGARETPRDGAPAGPDGAGPRRADDEVAPPMLEGTGRVEAPPPGPEDVRVRVVDASGAPLAGASVFVLDGGEVSARLVTDAAGEAVVRSVPPGSTLVVGTGEGPHDLDASAPLRGRLVLLEARAVLPLRVDPVDAETGAVLRGATWALGGEGVRGDPAVHVAGESVRVRLLGEEVARPFLVTPLRGHVEAEEAWRTPVSRYAQRLRAEAPLRRELPVTVLVRGPEGQDEPEATVTGWRLGGRLVAEPRVEAWILGGRPLRGVPFLAGETLEVEVQAPDGRVGRAQVVVPDALPDALEVPVVLGEVAEPWAPPPLEPEDAPARAGTVVPVGTASAEVGALDLLVLRRDARPATGARVHGPWSGARRTDGDGRLRVDPLPVGVHTVRLVEAGLVPTSLEIEVRPGAVAEATLREGPGGTLVLLVRTPEGRALPYASVRLETPTGGAAPWVDLDDGTQRLDPYVDAEGRRTLRHVEPGVVAVEGRWGGRRGRRELVLPSGATTEVELVLR